MNLIQQSVQQITRENLKNYYDTEQAEDELFNMLQSNRLYMMKDRTLDFIKQISGKSGIVTILEKQVNFIRLNQ